jgi:hypothetical protein
MDNSEIYLSSSTPPVINVIVGSSSSGPAGFSDTFNIGIKLNDSNVVPSDSGTFTINLAQSDTNSTQSETVKLEFPAPDFGDTSTAPTESRNFKVIVWMSASSGTGTTNPTNADGSNNGTIATLQTAALGTNPITLTSSLGSNVPTVLVTAILYRGWFKSVNTLVTSTGTLIMHSTTAAFSDIVMFTNSGLGATVDHLTGTFTFDLFAAGVNTLAKLQSCQMLHRVTDAVAGVTPHVLTVDAGSVEVTGAFT